MRFSAEDDVRQEDSGDVTEVEIGVLSDGVDDVVGNSSQGQIGHHGCGLCGSVSDTPKGKGWSLYREMKTMALIFPMCFPVSLAPQS